MTRSDLEREYARPPWQPMHTEAVALRRRYAGPRLGARRLWGPFGNQTGIVGC